jgi:PKD repeat protein
MESMMRTLIILISVTALLMSGVAFTTTAQDDVDVSGSIDWVCDPLLPRPEPAETSWHRTNPTVTPSLVWIVEQCAFWDGAAPVEDYYTITIPINWTSSPENRDSPRYDIPLTDDPMRAILIESGGGAGNMQARIAPDGTESVSHQYPAGQDACVARTVSDRVSCSLTGFDDPWNAGGSNNWYLDEISDGAYIRFSNTQVFGQSTSTVVSVTFVYWGIPPIDAKIEANTLHGAAPLTVRFTDASIGHDVRMWNVLGDFDWNDTNPEFEYTFDTPGTYYVGLTVLRHNDMYTDSAVVKITVTDYGAACLNQDSPLQNPDAWITSGTVSFQDQYVVLGPNASLRALHPLLLDGTIDHTVTVIADPLIPRAGGVDLGIKLGFEQKYVNVQGSAQVVFEDPTPDVGPLSSLVVTNTTNTQITLKRLCVDDGTLQLTPGTCFFDNYDFSRGLEGWGYDTGVTLDVVDGAIALPDGTGISQWVELFPDNLLVGQPYTYNIRVTANIGYKNRDVYLSDSSNTVSIAYTITGLGVNYLSGPDGIEQSLSSFRAASEPHRQRLPDGSLVFTGNVTVTDWISGPMVFNAHSTDPETVVRISEVCIDDEFEHHPGVWGNLITPVCHQIPAQPLNDTFGAWINWHWLNLSNFFTCDLMVMLNHMYSLAVSTYEFMVWAFIYIQTVLIMAVDFMGLAFEWADAHFYNIAAAGGVTHVANAETNFWDVIISLIERIFGPWMDAMITQLEAIWRIIEDAAATTFDLIYLVVDSVLNMANSILNAIILFSYMVLDFMLHTSNQVLNFIMDFIWMVVSESFHITNTIIDLIAFVIMTVVDTIAKIIIMLVETLVYIIMSVVDLIIYMITALFDVLTSFLGRILNFVVDTFTRLVDLIFSLVELTIFLVGTIIVGIINMIISVVIMVVSSIMNAGTMLVAVLGAWLGADPISTPGTPNCAINPQSSMICTAWWVLENTILGHPVGMMIIPITTATFAIHMVLWAIGEIRQSVISASRTA